MIFTILIFFAGIIAGTITGLLPGIHINLVSAILLSLPLSIWLPAESLVIFIVAMAITHTFIDFIPSVFLGAPDEDTGLLPGHRFLIEGYGHQAVVLSVFGSIIAIISLIILLPIFQNGLPLIYPLIKHMMGWFLIWISLFLIYHEKKSRFLATTIFILSGFLGIAALNSQIQNPLLPLFTGLFGASTLLYSIRLKTQVPPQKIENPSVKRKEFIRPIIATTLVSPICALFPGLGSSQATIIGSKITGNLNTRQFIILLGSVNTLVMASSFLALIVIQKIRTGAASAISQLVNPVNLSISTIIFTIIATSIIAAPLTILLSRLTAKQIPKVNYRLLSIGILLFLTLIILFFSDALGFLVFIISTILGLFCISLDVRRGFLMGVLLVPTIIYYLVF